MWQSRVRILDNLEDEFFVSELNEQFGYQFKLYGNDHIHSKAINDLGLNEKIHHDDL